MDYRQELSAKLDAARKRVRQGREMSALQGSAPTLFEIIDGEISLELNRAFGDTPLSYDEYMESHGAVRGIRRIRNLIDAKAIQAESSAAEVDAITETLKQFDDDAKQ